MRFLTPILAHLIVLPITVLSRLWPSIVLLVQVLAFFSLFAFIGALIGARF